MSSTYSIDIKRALRRYEEDTKRAKAKRCPACRKKVRHKSKDRYCSTKCLMKTIVSK